MTVLDWILAIATFIGGISVGVSYSLLRFEKWLHDQGYAIEETKEEEK